MTNDNKNKTPEGKKNTVVVLGENDLANVAGGAASNAAGDASVVDNGTPPNDQDPNAIQDPAGMGGPPPLEDPASRDFSNGVV